MPALLLLSLVLGGCFVPRRTWPQGDIQESELHEPALEKKVLVASRSSDFKNEVIAVIRKAFENEPVYMKFIGMDQLDREEGRVYSAVVLISTCIAWQLDPDVNRFLDRNKDMESIIVFTTSGGGDWVPDKKGRQFDAISSASKQADAGAIAGRIVDMIHKLLNVR